MTLHVCTSLAFQQSRIRPRTQLLKQTRGSPSSPATVRAWQLFYLLACLAPPGRSFVALTCEYVHSARAPGPAAAPSEARDWAARTWTALKRSTKAGPRRQVGRLANTAAWQVLDAQCPPSTQRQRARVPHNALKPCTMRCWTVSLTHAAGQLQRHSRLAQQL